jgi:hypothetical protein
LKKILLQLDCDPFPSVFDVVTAYDAGVDVVLQYGNVTKDNVRDLVYGVMFTRGGDRVEDLKCRFEKHVNRTRRMFHV